VPDAKVGNLLIHAVLAMKIAKKPRAKARGYYIKLLQSSTRIQTILTFTLS
jgi:hypothetical protein